MSSSVEDRIVSMKFDNKQFEPAARTTMSTLDRLKAALNFTGSNKGLNDLQASANRFSLAGVTGAVTGVSGKFLAMSAIAITAISNIVNKAVDAGIRIAKAFTIQPIQEGFQEYETKLGSIQTILANTQASGATLKDVSATLQELNAYSDKTIYNFGEMARNIGTFTAAGVDLKTSAMSIKGIANLAALSGSNSQQASTAMYQLSQAISAGKVSLQDWNSVVNAGMGGTVFQRALAQTAEKMGTLDKGAVKLTGKMKNVTIAGQSFRNSITAKPGEESWLTSKVLTETLKQFTGDMSDAELATMGFNKAQIKSIQEQAKTAENAATKVKSFTQLMGTLKESAGSGWAQTFEILIGDFEEAKKLWTDVSNIVGGFINRSSEARNEMLQDWKDLGGRSKALKGLRNIFAAIVSVIKPIGQAFREIFPATTGRQLFELTQRFLQFTKNLKIGGETAKDLKRTFAGVFAIFSIGWSFVKALLNVLGDLFGLVSEGSGGFLEFTGGIGDFLVSLDEAIKKGDVFNKFFETLGEIIRDPLSALQDAARAIGDFFKSFVDDPVGALSERFGYLGDVIRPLGAVAEVVSSAWSGLVGIFERVTDALQPMIDGIKEAFGGIRDAIAEAFTTGDWSGVLDAINAGLLVGIVVLIKKFMKNGLNLDFGQGGLIESVKGTFDTLTGSLKAMQTQVNAKTLLLIAGALALLTASILALSLIDSAKLTKAMTAIAVGFGQLLAAMAILTKISGHAGFLKIPIISASMILLATSVLILTAAVKNLSDLDWEELGKGLTGVGVLLGMIAGFSGLLDKTSGPMLRTGLAMIPLAIGIKILADAVEDFSDMSWGDMAKGLTGLAGALVIIAGAISLMPPTIGFQAAGLVILSVALKGIASALGDMGGMSWGEIAKGLVTLAGSLAIIAGALYLMAGTLPGAAGLIVAAGALAILAPVLDRMGKMSWEEIAKGMVVLAGSLLILAGGLTLMAATLPGSGALLVAAAALAVLTPILVALGDMTWEEIVKGLAALAGTFLILGVAGLVLAPVVPVILALGGALLVLGAGVALVGGGLLAIATALTVFAAAGAAGIAVIGGLISLIPLFMAKFAEGIGTFVVTLASQGTKITKAFTSLLTSLLNAVILIAPKLGQAFNVLLGTALNILIANVPRLVAAGVILTISLLSGIRSQISRIVPIAVDIIVRFLDGIAQNMSRIVRAGTNVILKFMAAIQSQQPVLLAAGARMIISFINNLANTVRANTSALRTAGLNLALAVIDGMTGGLASGVGRLAGQAASMARSALAAAKSALGINSPSKEFFEVGKWSAVGAAEGIRKNASDMENSAYAMGSSALDAVRQSLSGMSNVLSDVSNDPVITPILDLTQVSKEASKIGGMLDQKAVQADLSYRQALGISTAEKTKKDDISSESTPTEPTVIAKFEQNNYSPKALSAAEIYLNTRSQFSMAKEALGTK